MESKTGNKVKMEGKGLGSNNILATPFYYSPFSVTREWFWVRLQPYIRKKKGG